MFGKKCEKLTHTHIPSKRGGWYCVTCKREAARQRDAYARTRVMVLKARLRRKFNTQPDQWVAFMVKQGFVCAGCKKPMLKPCVDHDRTCCPTEKACGNCNRGLLCPHCNLSLGLVFDNPVTLENLAAYVREYNDSKEMANGRWLGGLDRLG
jgi:recombination endonuclease VII